MKAYKINVKFGKLLKKARKTKEISQEQLAEKLNLSRNHIGRIESGSVSITLTLVEKSARVLGIKPREILPFD